VIVSISKEEAINLLPDITENWVNRNGDLCGKFIGDDGKEYTFRLSDHLIDYFGSPKWGAYFQTNGMNHLPRWTMMTNWKV
jgi:hypothetical protein